MVTVPVPLYVLHENIYALVGLWLGFLPKILQSQSLVEEGELLKIMVQG